ncbi:MAG: UDP-N-acetylmuramoyl-L-alanyl-D-glutamate--2,6-diaminopimelate ligase [Candidatus Tokpelaia sp.]|uniref:UDP-N-acetylmuramoyl-L-alanyl-D-glutamate--2, 6-diaminopimelate ligase n=1 Tax=Candidatus Tokpelaia sp. TaxID=2233777 RepID=UPI0012393CBD|nr:UDP-N-acetylmuramoyl-L-alanyl-D-glutamate--2,6-diaminopimelate ligase [Candidatus Tokpelaia sp.]KAA6206494.1 MAG: UDP-N-acetylmuramoyl-L-alanyl-D-glutamate--2,6-diaminopimelate ligase [Candidatus Tokpelaia sp.]KAA6206561.1 MAG: UDP-N-acetylmuramoyl-L-alanyl-D-glutamate--2,6-diaminopimelate ligase [Candidatus Tokpelaia sp.]KAA6405858.1 UDP-N-acetylmuramoyl-L-alanyl-D-glutamate--2,6-diaminopimelate ligase [Candidatus Tokpelaia sp.]
MKVSYLLGEAIAADKSKALAETISISGVADDSRKVKAGYAFFAIAGNSTNGQAYAQAAEKQGAAVIIAEKGADLGARAIPVIYVQNIRHLLALAAARFYHSRPQIIVAVTGTSGKTSVAAFLRQIWENTGFAGASIGTIGVVAKDFSQSGALTTPGAVELALLLAQLARKHITHVVMEASSHGLEQCRLDGVKLTAAGFTNLGRDHMDYHPTIEAYFKAKMRLFDTLLPVGAKAVVFADSKYADKAVAHIEAAGRKALTVGRKGNFIKLKRVEHERFRQYAEIAFEDEIYELVLPLAGEFQLANALVAVGLALASSVPPAAAFRALERLQGAPGRLQLVGATAAGAPVYVDYAHKPDALENVLKSVRPFTNGRIVLVFGCGGDRDKGKRPIMGEIAVKLADIVIVTDDNPRSENAAIIRKQILAGAHGALEIADRRAAIRHAVGLLARGDTLIVAGKGHEEGQIIGDKTLPFSDQAEVANALHLSRGD